MIIRKIGLIRFLKHAFSHIADPIRRSSATGASLLDAVLGRARLDGAGDDDYNTDHRAQTLAALHRVGGPTTPQDYLFYHFDRAGVAWEND
jgi:hypothetical protein